MPGLPEISRGRPDADSIILGRVHGDASGSDHESPKTNLLWWTSTSLVSSASRTRVSAPDTLDVT